MEVGSVRVQRVPVALASFTALGAVITGSITAVVLQPCEVILATRIKHTTVFAGGAVASCTISLGIAGTLAKYGAAFNVFQAPGALVQQDTGVCGGESATANTNILATITVDGAHLVNQLTTGSVEFHFVIARCPTVALGVC